MSNIGSNECTIVAALSFSVEIENKHGVIGNSDSNHLF